MTLALVPEVEWHGSADLIDDDAELVALSKSSREIAGGIVRGHKMVRDAEPETGWSSLNNLETSRVRKPRLKSPLIRLPPGSLPKERVRVLQQWEGVVTEVTEDSFFADVQDIGDSSQPIEVVEIPSEEIPEDDLPLLAEGAVFYWSIGYETSEGGQLRRISEIRMRRMPRWSKREIQKVSKRAEELFELHGQ